MPGCTSSRAGLAAAARTMRRLARLGWWWRRGRGGRGGRDGRAGHRRRVPVAPDQGVRTRARDRRVAIGVLDDERVVAALVQRDGAVGGRNGCRDRGPARVVGARGASRSPEAATAGLRVAGAREAGHLIPALRGAERAARADDGELAPLFPHLHRPPTGTLGSGSGPARLSPVGDRPALAEGAGRPCAAQSRLFLRRRSARRDQQDHERRHDGARLPPSALCRPETRNLHAASS